MFHHRVTFGSSLLCCLVMSSITLPVAHADGPGFLRLFGRQKIEANPSKDYELTELEGPWLILAQTFSGPEGKSQAQKLVIELRRDYNLPAFVYDEQFDFTQPFAQLGPNQRPLRYANAAQYDAYAVLVGEFDSVDHPDVKTTLATLKKIQPVIFNEVTPESEVGAMASIRRIHNQLKKVNPNSTKGPMSNAFVTRNPLLPESFTQAPEVDSFVRNLNKDVEYGLLKCEGKYTVVVRTFEGLSTTMVGGFVKNDIEPSSERLDLSANLANQMVVALRKKGVEAYEFHDRSKSLVTIGSFASLGRMGPNGFEYDPLIRHVMTEYSASERFGTDPNTGAVVRYFNNINKIPFDVKPHPISVPKATKRSLYSAALGRE